MGGLTHTTIECMLGNVHHSMNHGLLPEFESQQRLNAVVQVQLLLQKAARHVLLQRKRYPDTINGTKMRGMSWRAPGLQQAPTVVLITGCSSISSSAS